MGYVNPAWFKTEDGTNTVQRNTAHAVSPSKLAITFWQRDTEIERWQLRCDTAQLNAWPHEVMNLDVHLPTGGVPYGRRLTHATVAYADYGAATVEATYRTDDSSWTKVGTASQESIGPSS